MKRRYPDCVVVLSGTSANSVLIIMAVCRGLEKHLRHQGVPEGDISKVVAEFMEEAKSGGPEQVLITAHQWVDVH